MNIKVHTLPIALAALMTLSLAACGGGGGGAGSQGGGSSVQPPVEPPVNVVASTGTLQTTVPAFTYDAASVQFGMLTKLNEVRAAAGAGILQQSSLMDVASQAHAVYLQANSGDAHVEVAGKVGFYADTLGARLTKAGFAYGKTTETIGGTGPSYLGKDCTLGLLSTVYHGIAVLDQYTFAGVGSLPDGLGAPMCITDFATASGTKNVQVHASGELVTYPYGNQADVIEIFYVSAETPRVSATLVPNATAGAPVLVNMRNADFVNLQATSKLDAKVSKFELRDASGKLLPAVLLGSAAIKGEGVALNVDSNIPEGWIALVPLTVLTKNATYSASFKSTLKAGMNLDRDWAFKTNP